MKDYQQARKQSFDSVGAIRIFGVPLKGNLKDTHIAILWCGIAAEGREIRQGSKRIWHFPKKDIISTGTIKDFEFDGQQVHFYDLDPNCDPVEEIYSIVSLSHTAKLFLGLIFRGGGSGSGETGPIPVTISPSPTEAPTGTPPITIQP